MHIKKTRAVALAFLLIGIARPAVVLSQTYYFNSLVYGRFDNVGMGFLEIAYSEPNGIYKGTGREAGTAGEVDFGTLNGAITYDLAGNSAQLFTGNVAVSPFGASLSFDDSQVINGNLVPATVTINYSIGNVNNGLMSFSTPFADTSFNLPVPISGCYSLVTGGETYKGDFSYTIGLGVNMQVTSATSASLSFSQDDEGYLLGGIELAQVTAADGVVMDLGTEDPNDGATYLGWSMDGITAVVPEPTPFALLGCGLSAFTLLRRRAKELAGGFRARP